MSPQKTIGVVGIAIAMGFFLFTPSIHSDPWNKKTVMTTNQTLMIPGATLQPGKYVIKLADSQSNRHIVQVFNEDESKILATILAIPNHRLQPKGDTEFGFWETPTGKPPALRSWFYPGDNFGQEFAYPKDQAMALSASVGQQVPAITAEDQTVLEQPPAPAPVQQAQVESAPEPAPEPPPAVDSAPAPITAEPDIQVSRPSEPRPVRDELPRTASYVPLIGLAGLLFLGMAAVLRMAR